MNPIPSCRDGGIMSRRQPLRNGAGGTIIWASPLTNRVQVSSI